VNAAPGSRQQRNQPDPQAPGPNRLLSDEAMLYVAAAAPHQAAALRDPSLNGEDSARRVTALTMRIGRRVGAVSTRR
jgi:hypothetical protein